MFERLRNLFRRKPGMVGPPPSSRRVPLDPGLHAADFSKRWADRLDAYCGSRMEELGIPGKKLGASDPLRRIPWCAFNPHDTDGGNITTGITVNSGVLNPELFAGQEVGRTWAGARLRDRIDAIIAHEWEEDRLGTHDAAVGASPETELPISEGARRILRAMSR